MNLFILFYLAHHLNILGRALFGADAASLAVVQVHLVDFVDREDHSVRAEDDAELAVGAFLVKEDRFLGPPSAGQVS